MKETFCKLWRKILKRNTSATFCRTDASATDIFPGTTITLHAIPSTSAKTNANLSIGYTYTTGAPSLTTTCQHTTPLSWMFPADMLLTKVSEQIDQKTLSDYEFREWLRDNLANCSYNPGLGFERYAHMPQAAPISILDALLVDSA